MDKKITLRLDDSLLTWVSDKAERDHRTVGGQIRYFLDRERQTNLSSDVKMSDCARYSEAVRGE